MLFDEASYENARPDYENLKPLNNILATQNF